MHYMWPDRLPQYTMDAYTQISAVKEHLKIWRFITKIPRKINKRQTSRRAPNCFSSSVKDGKCHVRVVTSGTGSHASSNTWITWMGHNLLKSFFSLFGNIYFGVWSQNPPKNATFALCFGPSRFDFQCKPMSLLKFTPPPLLRLDLWVPAAALLDQWRQLCVEMFFCWMYSGACISRIPLTSEDIKAQINYHWRNVLNKKTCLELIKKALQMVRWD